LQAPRACGKIRRKITLNSPAPTDPKELRPLLHAEVDKLCDEDLSAARKALLEIELNRVTAELGREMDEAWASGRITKESIDEAVREYRRTHPDRR
jgi:hypothetical protein